MATIEQATPADVIAQVRTRKHQASRWGLGLASAYLRRIEATCSPKDMFGAETWADDMKRAEQTLTWCQDDMAPEAIALTVEPPGDGTSDEYHTRVRRLAEEDWYYKAAELTAGAIMEFDAVLTSRKRDRDGDILDPKGARLDKNMPLLWQHVPSEPIGKFVKEGRRNGKRISGKLAIADTALGRDAAVLVEFGALRISHGFVPDMDAIDEIKEGEEGWLFRAWEMIEVSLVSVPSNTDAVITAFSRGKLFHPAVKAWAKGEHDARPVQVPGQDFVLAGLPMKCLICEEEYPATKSDAGLCSKCLERKATGSRQRLADQTSRTVEIEVPEGLELQDADWITAKRGDDGRYVLHTASAPDLSPDELAVFRSKPDRDSCDVCGETANTTTYTSHRWCEDHTPEACKSKPRWNRRHSKAFDVAREYVEPSKLEYDWVSRFLGCDVKQVFRNSAKIPAARMASVLSGLRHLTAGATTKDIRNITDTGKEVPPLYEVVQLNSTSSDDFLVDGITFYVGDECKFVINLSPDWCGLRMVVYTSVSNKTFNRKLFDDMFRWAKENNFLKGEAFSLSGEFLPKTDESWDDVFLPARNKKPSERIVKALNAKGKSTATRGMMLMGPPGTGKTLCGRIMRNTADATFIWISSRDFYYMGAFEGLTYGFDLARELAPSILFIEDVDSWLGPSAMDLLKTEMDGIGRSTGTATILTTNYPERMPEALIDRPGRFHDVLLFELPDESTREAMLKAWVTGASDKAIRHATKATDGYSGAHLYELAQYALDMADIEGGGIDSALKDSLAKIAEQRQLITDAQLAGSNYKQVTTTMASRTSPGGRHDDYSVTERLGDEEPNSNARHSPPAKADVHNSLPAVLTWLPVATPADRKQITDTIDALTEQDKRADLIGFLRKPAAK